MYYIVIISNNGDGKYCYRIRAYTANRYDIPRLMKEYKGAMWSPFVRDGSTGKRYVWREIFDRWDKPFPKYAPLEVANG